MELFDSYILGNSYYCDATSTCEYPAPNSRVFCHDLSTMCGICNGLITTNGFVLCDCDDSWNCNLCANDQPFWIPFESAAPLNGDTFDFQFQQVDEVTEVECINGWLPSNLLSPTNTAFATFEIRTCCDDEPLDLTEQMFDAIAPLNYVGSYNTTDYLGNVTASPIQMIRFNLNAIRQYLEAEERETCFYFLFTFTATRFCLGLTEKTNEYCSEPFKPVICDKNNTQVIESIYPKKDCFSFYYGNSYNSGIGTPFQYSNRLRVPGFFEQSSFSITKEIIGASLRTTMSQYNEIWQLKTTHVPPSFAKYIVNVLSGRNVFVNGKEYQVQGEINRNNEGGSHWYMEINFETLECNKSLTCE
jgi:hypothetical protein